MPRQVVLDASLMRAWSVRGLLLGLMARDPPVFVPRWAPGMLDELADMVAADAAPARGAEAARHHALSVTRDIGAAFPEVEEAFEGAAPPPSADALLLDLHGDDAARVLHATVMFAFVLRRPDRTLANLMDALHVPAPEFVAVLRAQIAALPAGQHATPHAAAAEPDAPRDEHVDDGWWSIACDPFPCPGHDADALDLWGTRATCLSGRECSFVGVTQTVRHRTLVWPAGDDPSLLEVAARMRDEHRNPRPVRYANWMGPPVSYWEWAATGNLVHGVHEASRDPGSPPGRR